MVSEISFVQSNSAGSRTAAKSNRHYVVPMINTVLLMRPPHGHQSTAKFLIPNLDMTGRRDLDRLSHSV